MYLEMIESILFPLTYCNMTSSKLLNGKHAVNVLINSSVSSVFVDLIHGLFGCSESYVFMYIKLSLQRSRKIELCFKSSLGQF